VRNLTVSGRLYSNGSYGRNELLNDISPGGRPREKCGIFAVYNLDNPEKTSHISYLGLLALQHRGQESAGMAYQGTKGIECFKGMGLVENVFTRSVLNSIRAATILGHVRYSTTGSSEVDNAQPLLARSFNKTGIALAHNGNLTNTRRLYNEQIFDGQIFHTTSDTEIMLSYIFRYRHQGLVKAVQKTMDIVKGAYAAVIMDEEQVVAFRDPGGYRPLVIGRLGQAYVFTSETAALDAVGAVFLREIEPGEIVSVGPDGLNSLVTFQQGVKPSLCIFEYVYFSRPDSNIDGQSVHIVRKKVGSLLAGRIPVIPDMVIPSPDSGVSAAMGLAEALDLPLEWAVHRNPYLGRTFIAPTRDEREIAVRLKFNPIARLVEGKKVAIVDDSLVRGTTARVLTRLLRNSGTAEVHLCIASPPYKNPCYYGIDIPVAAELAALESGFNQLEGSIGANSLTFSEPEDLYRALGKGKNEYCTACFSGEYKENNMNEVRGNDPISE